MHKIDSINGTRSSERLANPRAFLPLMLMTICEAA